MEKKKSLLKTIFAEDMKLTFFNSNARRIKRGLDSAIDNIKDEYLDRDQKIYKILSKVKPAMEADNKEVKLAEVFNEYVTFRRKEEQQKQTLAYLEEIKVALDTDVTPESL